MRLSLGGQVLVHAMARSAARAFRPSSRLTGSTWTEEHMHLERLGRWRWQSAPYMRGIQDSLCDPRVPRITLMKGSQIGGTTGGLISMLGYAVHQRPTRVLAYFPSEGDAKKFSRDKLDACFRQSPALRGSFTHDSLFEKRFPGGMIFIQSGGTPRTFRQTDAEWVVLDDLDGFELEVGDEGGPVGLADNRLKSYRRGKRAAISTPTIKDFSAIEDLFDESDQRRFHVPCPHCEARQVLRWGGRDKPFGFKWDSTSIDGELVPVLDSVAYLCEACGSLIDEKDKPWMVRTAAERYEDHGWVAEHPERSPEHHGFHLPQFVSLFPGASWRSILAQWHGAKGDPGKLKIVVNQVFAETWEERGEKVDSGKLEGRAEVYVGRDGEPIEVPDGVGVLTAGVDVQANRFELLVRGYGLDWESWDIFHERIWGDVQQAEPRGRLLALLGRGFELDSGMKLPIEATMIDSGHEAAVVYGFVRSLQKRKIWASKGDKGEPKAELLQAAVKPNKMGVILWRIGTFPAKRDLFRRLQVVRPGPRHIHVRQADPALCNGFDAEYFAQFEAEKMIMEQRRPTFKAVRTRNEAIDLHVLADSALRSLGAGVIEQMAARVEANHSGQPLRRRRRKARVLHRGVS
jgi:phage terminase large subunit GpA-like protein